MRARILATGLVVTLVMTGCGPGGAPVEGKAEIGGKAYSPDNDGDLNITLKSESGSTTFSGKVQPDGSFKVVSDKGGGVPAGKYKVAITRYPSKAEIAKLKGPPTPLNKETGEVWDVGAGKTFTLDVSKVK